MAKRKTIPHLEAAVNTVDDGVPEPSRRRSSSFASVIADLEIGETASKAQRVEDDTTLAEFAEKSAAWREALRNTCATSMRQAKARTGGEYSIEIADVMTQARSLFIVALITRTS